MPDTHRGNEHDEGDRLHAPWSLPWCLWNAPIQTSSKGALYQRENASSPSKTKHHRPGCWLIIYPTSTAMHEPRATTGSVKKVPAGAVPLFGDSAGEDDLFGSSPTSKAAGVSAQICNFVYLSLLMVSVGDSVRLHRKCSPMKNRTVLLVVLS